MLKLPRVLHFLCCLFVCSGIGCASIQDSYVATPVDEQGNLAEHHRTTSGLVISGQELAAYASPHFGMVEVTLENHSSEWLHISRLALDFVSPEKNAGVALTAGSDLTARYNATVQRNDIRATNSAAALEGLLLVGETAAMVGAASGKRPIAAAGAATALGALTIDRANAYGDQIASVERVRDLPSSHLLALPIAVPPGLFSKRWVLLNTSDARTPCIRKMLLDYDVQVGDVGAGDAQAGNAPARAVSNKGRERVLLEFRAGGDRSEWQSSVCMPRKFAGPGGYH